MNESTASAEMVPADIASVDTEQDELGQALQAKLVQVRETNSVNGAGANGATSKESFSERVKRLHAELEARKAAAQPTQPILPAGMLTGLEDLETATERHYGPDEFKAHVKGLSMDVALQYFYIKQTPKRGSGAEHQFSCPWPEHPDKNPSASINSTKREWMCYACEGGGDWIELYAATFGHTSPGQKVGRQLNTVLQEMKERFFPEWIKREMVTPMEVAPATSAAGTPSVEVVEADDTSDTDEVEHEDAELAKDYPTYDIRKLKLPENSFLHAYVTEGLKADVPREFPLWAGLAALSVALGRQLALKHIEIPTYANLSICLTSNSASGKGRTTRPAVELIRKALPHDGTPLLSGLPPEGARVLGLPGSGEAMIDELDEACGEKHYSTPALIEFEEMQTLVGKGAGNSSYKSYIIQFADCLNVITRNSKAHGKGIVVNGFVTFLTATQPRHLRDQFTRRDEGSGLLNRFIFPFGRPVPQRSRGIADQDWTLPSMHLVVIRNWITKLDQNSPDKNAHWIRTDTDWTDGALQKWDEFHDAVINPDLVGPNSNLLGRMNLNMLRLILLFAANDKSEKVTGDHVDSALALYDYIKACALSLAREVRASEVSDNMKIFMTRVKEFEVLKKKPPTLRELKNLTGIKQLNDEERIAVMRQLTMGRHLFEVKRIGTRGPSTLAYTTDPMRWAASGVAVPVSR